MTNLNEIENLKKRFKYQLGAIFIDGWRQVGDNNRGDCDDFALTVAFILADRSWMRFAMNVLTLRTVFWLVYSPSNRIFPRHVALYHKGCGWIDSTNRKWRDSPAPHRKIFPIPFPYAYIRVAWGSLYSLIFS